MWPPFPPLTFPLKSQSTGPCSNFQAIFSTLSTWLHWQTLSWSLTLQPPRLPCCPSCTLGSACVPSARKCSSFRNLHNSLCHPFGSLLKCQFSNEAFYNFFVKTAHCPLLLILFISLLWFIFLHRAYHHLKYYIFYLVSLSSFFYSTL